MIRILRHCFFFLLPPFGLKSTLFTNMYRVPLCWARFALDNILIHVDTEPADLC